MSDHTFPAEGLSGASTNETFARFLAKKMIIQDGYVEGAVPEALTLEAACDYLLFRSDGLSFEIVCILDAEADPKRAFDFPLAQLREIGNACLAYTGKVARTKMPVSIRLIEVRHTTQASDVQRLKAYFQRSTPRRRVAIAPWLLDVARSTVWTAVPFNGLLAGRPALEQAMRAPRKSLEDMVADIPVAPADVGKPWLTYGLLGLIVCVFGLELVFGIGPTSGLLAPQLDTLIALGGDMRALVLGGDWYRLVTACLLHGDLMHLAFNGIALYMAGGILELLVGRAWLGALFVLGGLGGSLMSLLLNDPHVVSIGASGAIMALIAATYLVSRRLPHGPERSQVQAGMLQMLIPAMIPLATPSGGHIDVAAHLGGALTGGLIGFMLLKAWPAREALPPFRKVASGIGAVGILATFVSGFEVQRHYAEWGLLQCLVPSDQLPKSTAEFKAHSAELAAAYPRDPQVRLFRAIALYDQKKPLEAETQLETGLKETTILRQFFDDQDLEVRMRFTLATILLEQGKKREASQAIDPVRHAGPGGQLPDLLKKLDLSGS